MLQIAVFLLVALSVAGADDSAGISSSEGADVTQNVTAIPKPDVYKFHVFSTVQYRFAHTVISSRIANPANVSQEVSFTAVLPETAFISGFLMEVDGVVYNAYVKEKEEARQEYNEAVRQGKTAAHVALSARDSNRFTVSVNVEPQKKITFNLTYEELLNRKLGTYKHVINLDPGQIVPDFKVEVHIEESSDITNLTVPALRVSNEIDADPSAGQNNPLATIEYPTKHSAVVKFVPTSQQQVELARDGIKGQLIVQYDVDRKSHPGDILVNDGYFVHFFAPNDLPALKKQVTFVLDVSGSMGGRKIEQLRQAMTTILGDLNPGDLFSIVLFSSTVQVWDPTLNDTALLDRIQKLGAYPWDNEPEGSQVNLLPSVVAPVTDEMITKAKDFVQDLTSIGATNINSALLTALHISKLETLGSAGETNDINSEKHEPIIVFLTDGQPNVGVNDPKTIVSQVTAENTQNSSIFTLALGDDADLGFLKKLSLKNSGFARKIYEASDTALQLRDFYRQIASPLLANVTFKYVDGQVDDSTITTLNFRRLFNGGELVVAGRLRSENMTGKVEGRTTSGFTEYPFIPISCLPIPLPPQHNTSNVTASPMERLWAYLTIQQLLEKDEASDASLEEYNQTSPEKQRALELALQYSFVTPLTSLVVVKPNETRSVNTEDASQPETYQDSSVSNLALTRFYSAIPPMAPMPAAVSSFSLRAGYGGVAGYIGGAGAFPALPPSTAISHKIQPISHPVASPDMPPPLPTVTPVILPLDLALDDLSNVTWIPANGSSEIILPTGLHGTDEVLELASSNETNTAYSICSSPRVLMGHCRHLRFCVLDIFTNSIDEFLPFFCRINNFVGVCCPDNLQPVTN